jgi:hypothetical protein
MLDGTIVSSYLVDYTSPPTGHDPDAVPQPSIHNRTLQKAADHVGGPRALARYLKVPLGDLYAWMRPGAVAPPAAVFLRAVDLVLNDLDMPDAQRAQKVRVAVIHEDRRRAEVMQALQDLLPDAKP